MKPEDVREGWWLVRNTGAKGDPLTFFRVDRSVEGLYVNDEYCPAIEDVDCEWLRGPLDLEALAAEAERDEMVKGFMRWKQCDCGRKVSAMFAPPLARLGTACNCGATLVVTLNDMTCEQMLASEARGDGPLTIIDISDPLRPEFVRREPAP